jgi:hypothetical protein
MSASFIKQQKQGENGRGKAGKKKMVEVRCVQKMYVQGRCMNGMCAIVCKNGVGVCVYTANNMQSKY